MKSHSKSNEELLTILTELIKNYPELRFGQILRNYGFVKEIRPANPDNFVDWQNEFYTEPEVILNRVKNYVKNTKE